MTLPTPTELRIASDRGQSLAATFQAPEGTGPWPGVLLCQGMSGVRGLVLPHVAERLGRSGIATIRFDYAGFGESTGVRGWIDPHARVADARFALEALLAQHDVDAGRVGAYGHSLGGPVALAIAGDTRIRAMAAVSSPGDGIDMLRAARPAWEWVELRHRVDTERARIAAGEQPTAVGIEEIFPFSPKFAAGYAKLKSTGTSALAPGSGLGTSSFYLATVDRIVESRPTHSARLLAHCACLLVSGESDDTAPIETVAPVFTAIAGSKRWDVIRGKDHNDLDSGEGLDDALERVGEWFGHQLR